MQNPCTPLFQEGRNITGRATAAVVGKRVLAISTNGTEGVPNVAYATAAGKWFGVSGYDAAPTDPQAGLLPVIRKGVVPITTSAAVTAGAEVEVGANGTVVPRSAGIAIGQALFDAASGADALVALYE